MKIISRGSCNSLDRHEFHIFYNVRSSQLFENKLYNRIVRAREAPAVNGAARIPPIAIKPLVMPRAPPVV